MPEVDTAMRVQGFKARHRLTVLHSTQVWLPQTQTWIYSQVKELQGLKVDTHVACRRTEKLEQFHIPNIHAASSHSTEQLASRSPAKAPPTHPLLHAGSTIGTSIARSTVGKMFVTYLRKNRISPDVAHLVQVAKTIGANIVHSHFGHVGWANLPAVRALSAKHVVTFYGLDVNQLPTQSPVWKQRYRELFAEVDAVLCEGSHMARCIVALGCPERKVKVQHLGVDLSHIEFKPRRWNPGEPLRVLMAASFREKKGIPYGIEALGMLARRQPIEVTIIGDAGPDAEGQAEKARILDALRRSGLAAKTRLLGYQQHAKMLEEAYAHHVFLHPSVTAKDGDTEGGAPVCITEMMASGMPVVSTRHCDIPEVVGPSLHHLLAPERNAGALVQCLSALLETPDTWETLLRRGRDRVETEYDKVRQAACLREHYERCLKG